MPSVRPGNTRGGRICDNAADHSAETLGIGGHEGSWMVGRRRHYVRSEGRRVDVRSVLKEPQNGRRAFYSPNTTRSLSPSTTCGSSRTFSRSSKPSNGLSAASLCALFLPIPGSASSADMGMELMSNG